MVNLPSCSSDGLVWFLLWLKTESCAQYLTALGHCRRRMACNKYIQCIPPIRKYCADWQRLVRFSAPVARSAEPFMRHDGLHALITDSCCQQVAEYRDSPPINQLGGCHAYLSCPHTSFNLQCALGIAINTVAGKSENLFPLQNKFISS